MPGGSFRTKREPAKAEPPRVLLTLWLRKPGTASASVSKRAKPDSSGLRAGQTTVRAAKR
jgi:hypothetical protein